MRKGFKHATPKEKLPELTVMITNHHSSYWTDIPNLFFAFPPKLSQLVFQDEKVENCCWNLGKMFNFVGSL